MSRHIYKLCKLCKFVQYKSTINDLYIQPLIVYKLYDMDDKLIFESNYIDEVDLYCEEHDLFYETDPEWETKTLLSTGSTRC